MAKRFTAQRRERLAEMVREEGFLSVADAASRLGVSGETIRKDLIYLQGQGALIKSHGGAVSPEERSETPVHQKMTEQVEAKRLVATRALGLVPQGGSVLLDAGTSVLALADLLRDRSDLTVFTNSVPVLSTLAKSANSVFILGGKARPTSLAVVGDWANRQLGSISVDVAFMGTDGFTDSTGPSTTAFEEVEVKRRMVDSSARVVVLADKGKCGRGAPFQFCPWKSVDVLVTDGIPEDFDAAGIGETTDIVLAV